MAKTWCSNCGNCITFENKKPNFCFGCGESITGIARAKIRQELDEPEEDVEDVLTPQKHKIIIEVRDAERRGLSIEDILSNPTIVPVSGSRGSRTSLKQIRKKCQSRDPIEI